MKNNFDDIPSQIKELIESRVYGNMPVKKLAVDFKISVAEVNKHLREYDDYVAFVTEERRLENKGKYQKMDKTAMATIKSILKTEHEVDVIAMSNGEPVKVGTKIDANIMKIKKEVAEKILENTGAKDKEVKGGGININNDNRSVNGKTAPEKSDKEIIEDQRKNEVMGLLDDCKIIEVEQEAIK